MRWDVVDGEAAVLGGYKLVGSEVLEGLGKVPCALVVGVALFPPFVYFGLKSYHTPR